MAGSGERYRVVNFFDWTGGVQNRRRNPLHFPPNAIMKGENVELTDGGVRTRGGMSIMSPDSLPYGEIMAMEQVRFPSNEVSYLLVQVRESARPASDWREVAGIGVGNGREDHSAVWDPISGRMYVFGGVRQGNLLNDLWSYDPNVDTWALLSPAGGPPAPRKCHTAVHDAVGNRMIVFGGTDDGVAHLYNDVWAYNYTSNTWTELLTTGDIADGQASHAAIYRPTDRSMWVFGGHGASGSFGLYLVHRLDLATLAWAELPADVDQDRWFNSASRYAHRACYVSSRDSVILWGGADSDSTLRNDAGWSGELTLSSMTWRGIEPFPKIGPGRHDGVVYNDTLISFFGRETDYENNLVDDLFLYEEDAWQPRVMQGSAPPPRVGHSTVITYDGSIILFGGSDSEVFQDCWVIDAAALVG